MAGFTPVTLVINVQVQLTFWQAVKLRIGGARFMEAYLKMIIEEHKTRLAQEEDDASQGW